MGIGREQRFLSNVACSLSMVDASTGAKAKAEAQRIAAQLSDVPLAYNAALYLLCRGERPRESSVRRIAKKVEGLL